MICARAGCGATIGRLANQDSRSQSLAADRTSSAHASDQLFARNLISGRKTVGSDSAATRGTPKGGTNGFSPNDNVRIGGSGASESAPAATPVVSRAAAVVS